MSLYWQQRILVFQKKDLHRVKNSHLNSLGTKDKRTANVAILKAKKGKLYCASLWNKTGTKRV